MIVGDAKKLWEAVRATHAPGSRLTFSQIEAVAPPECITPSRRSLSRSHLRQLIDHGLISSTGGPMATAIYTIEHK